jgi:hypothetical protein
MTDFPELQSALVDAARERYGRRVRIPRFPRRLVPIAAACAVAAAIAIVVATRPADREQAAPPATPPAEQLERSFEIFRRPATPADALPLTGKRLERFASGRGDAKMDVGTSRLAYKENTHRLYLIEAEIDGRPAVCTSWFRGDLELSGFCGPLDDTGVVYTVVPARFGEPNTVLGAAVDGVKLVSAISDRAHFGWEVQNNGVLLRVDHFPSRVFWTDATGRERSIDPPPATVDDRALPASECPTLGSLPADAEATAERLALELARSQFPEYTPRATGVGIAHGFVQGCGPAVAERTIVVTVALESGSGATSAQFGFGRFDGRFQPWFSEGR